MENASSLTEEYTFLFHRVTEVVKELNYITGKLYDATRQLESAQQGAEEIFISGK